MTDPPARTAAAVLDQLAAKDAPLLNLLALCRTPEYQGVWAQGPQLLRRFAVCGQCPR